MSRYALHDHLDDAFKRKFAREQLVADRNQGRVDNTAQSMKVKPTQLSAISDLDAHVRANSTTDSSPNSSTDSSPELTDSAPSMVESGAESSAESGAYEKVPPRPKVPGGSFYRLVSDMCSHAFARSTKKDRA